MGKVGYIYSSIKDQLKWNNLSSKKYVRLISQVGQILSLRDEDYKKEKAKAIKMSNSSIADALIAVFGESHG